MVARLFSGAHCFIPGGEGGGSEKQHAQKRRVVSVIQKAVVAAEHEPTYTDWTASLVEIMPSTDPFVGPPVPFLVSWGELVVAPLSTLEAWVLLAQWGLKTEGKAPAVARRCGVLMESYLCGGWARRWRAMGQPKSRPL